MQDPIETDWHVAIKKNLGTCLKYLRKFLQTMLAHYIGARDIINSESLVGIIFDVDDDWVTTNVLRTTIDMPPIFSQAMGAASADDTESDNDY